MFYDKVVLTDFNKYLLTINKCFVKGEGGVCSEMSEKLNQYYIFWCLEEEEIIHLGNVFMKITFKLGFEGVLKARILTGRDGKGIQAEGMSGPKMWRWGNTVFVSIGCVLEIMNSVV